MLLVCPVKPTSGARFGPYEVESEIARGGMGRVLAARDVETGARVAIKVLAIPLEGRSRERFEREARALALSRHPNVVDVLDAGITPEGTPYIVMELLDGATLLALLEERTRIASTQLVALGKQVCSALSFAHAHGIVHRDIKPSNLVLVRRPDGRGDLVKVIDFGVARLDAPGDAPSKVTREGTLVGTPEYMAPEQLMGTARPDARMDLYATAASLFECATGTLPREGSSGELFARAWRADFRVPARFRATLGPKLCAFFERALAREPALRFETAAMLSRGLSEAVEGAPEELDLLLQLPPGRRGTRTVTTKDEPERRVARRRVVKAVLTILHPNGVVAAQLADLSIDGVRVELKAEEAWRSGDPVVLRLRLRNPMHDVTVAAEVRWVAMHGDAMYAGLAFKRRSNEVRQMLEELVQRSSA